MNALRQTLTEAEKIQPAKDLPERERFDDGSVVRARDTERGVK